MNKEYKLILRMNTPLGEEVVGTFLLGCCGDQAGKLFDQLQGQEACGTGQFIYFELMEIVNDLPTNLKLIACNLEQVGNNTKIILKELFKNSLL